MLQRSSDSSQGLACPSDFTEVTLHHHDKEEALRPCGTTEGPTVRGVKSEGDTDMVRLTGGSQERCVWYILNQLFKQMVGLYIPTT